MAAADHPSISHAAINQYLLAAGPTAANLQQQHMAAGWDRRTEARQLHEPCSQYHVSSAKIQ